VRDGKKWYVYLYVYMRERRKWQVKELQFGNKTRTSIKLP